MNGHRWFSALLWLAACAAALDAQVQPAEEPLASFDVLTGAEWVAQGEGFATVLTYRWLLSGRMLEARNEVRAADGRLLARYHGAYAWDRGRNAIVFLTAGESGEVHRGRAWWQDGVLWHEAEVSGGEIAAYASAVRPTNDHLEYFAAYGRTDAGPYLLDTEPLRYARAGVGASVGSATDSAAVTAPAAAATGSAAAGPLDALRFMAGCWRGELSNGAALEEQYTAPSANLMLGVSRFMRGDRAVQYEFSRITADSAGVVVLHPYPNGEASEHGFRMTRSEDGSALFEAPEHDFPKRIRYTRGDDGALTARIDGGAGDPRVQEWRMLAVRCGAS